MKKRLRVWFLLLRRPILKIWNLLTLYQVEKQQMKYLSQSIKLEESANPYVIRFTMAAISFAFFTFLLWAAITNVNEIAQASGEVVPKGFVQTVQHLDGGIVTDILIAEGQLVEKDQVLLRIDDGRTRQELAEAKVRQSSLHLQSERLQAFVEKRAPDFVSIAGTTPATIEQQKKVFASMVKARKRDRIVTQKQLLLKKKDLETRMERRRSIQRKLKIAKETLRIQRRLLKKGHTSRIVYLQHRKEVQELSGKYNENRSEIRGARVAIKEYEERLSSLDAKFDDDAYQQLDQVESRFKQNQEVVLRLQDKVSRLEMRAPVRGLVKGLKVNTIGGVVPAAESLMEIVPIGEKLIVAAQVSPQDIGHVAVGQKVKVKVSSFDFARYGTIDGEIEALSATTFAAKDGEPYYRCRIVLDKNYVGGESSKNLILPGMTIEADIITGQKSILSYLVKPIHRSIASAFSER